ncbi:MAG: class I SAM-dependent RNA methyltransferase [bacterium]
METGKRINVKIESIAFGGEGIARVNNRVVFIRNVVDGETVEVEIMEERKNFLKAKLISIEGKSPFRIDPPCPYYSECAGCQYQHIDYNHQLDIKRKQVGETIKHIAKIDLPVGSLIPSPETYNYRRLLEFHSLQNTTGFYTYNNKTIVGVDNCMLGEDKINEYYKNLKKKDEPLSSSFRIILDDSGEAYSTITDKKKILNYHVMGTKFFVPINSFFQTNRSLLEKMAETVINYSGAEKDEVFFDCFSGVGFFSVFLAGKAARVYGFEEGYEASEIASQNALINGIKNFVSIQGKTEKKLPKLLKEIIPDTIILDPPRVGCHPDILELTGRHKIKKIVYVSCNPSTLARDIVILKGFGYELKKVQPIDMFPQTSHIEVVSLLELIS